MATRASNPTLLRKAVLVHAPEFDVACAARLRITQDSIRKTGSISIQITTEVAGLDNGPRLIVLNIHPEMVITSAVALQSNDNLLPPRLLAMAPTPSNTTSAMSTLTLDLNATGVVLSPLGAETLSPANASDLQFHAFSKICQAKNIRLHFSCRQLGPEERKQLECFSYALRAGKLEAEHFNLARFDAGRGAVETDWRVFKQMNPPSYGEAVSKDKKVLGKRSRETRSSSPQETTPKKVLSPSYSSTILNTPSTRSPSPNIRPARFTNIKVTNEDKLTKIQEELKGLPDHLVRDILIESGHQHLLSDPKNQNPSLESHSTGVTSAQVNEMITARLDQFVNQNLDPLTKATFKSLTQTRLDDLVESHLPVAAELFLNAATNKHRDNFYEDCKINEINLREQLDEGLTEVREVADGCCGEIRDQVQQYLNI